MAEVDIAIHGQTARRAVSAEARQVPSLLWHVDDVSLVRLEHRNALDVVANLAEQNEPEFRALFVEMSFVGQRRRRDAAAKNDVGHGSIVVDELPRRIG